MDEVAKALGEHPGSARTPVEQHVGAGQQSAQVARRGEGDRPLARVPVGERVPVEFTAGLVALRRLDEDDLMTEPDQEPSREPGEGAGQFDDSQHVVLPGRQWPSWLRKPLTTL